MPATAPHTNVTINANNAVTAPIFGNKFDDGTSNAAQPVCQQQTTVCSGNYYTTAVATTAAISPPPMLGRRLLGTLLVSLPDGVILECHDSMMASNATDGIGTTIGQQQREDREDIDGIPAVIDGTTATTPGREVPTDTKDVDGTSAIGGGASGAIGEQFLLLSSIARQGHSLLALLHGKGAQTMLLNAFCGHTRRRMYARLKW